MRTIIYIFTFVFALIGTTFTSSAQICETAIPVCTDSLYNFENAVSSVAPIGPNYGYCPLLASANPIDNPAWYYFRIQDSGTLLIEIHQTSGPFQTGIDLDLDFVMWGPFDSFEEGCVDVMNGIPPIQMSYDPAGIEYLGLGMQGGLDTWCPGSPYGPTTPPAAIAGEYYIVFTSNPSNQAGYVSFNQIAGTGSAGCDILTPCEIQNVTAVVSECDDDYEFSVSGEVTVLFGGMPEAGDLVVEDCNGTTFVLASAPFTDSVFTYTFSGLDANGEECFVKVYFTDDNLCMETVPYTSPLCLPPCVPPTIENVILTHPTTIDDCDGLISVTIEGGVPPYAVVWFSETDTLIQITPNSSVISNLCSGQYTIKISDGVDCYYEEIFEILGKLPDMTYNIPNVFTPNNDGSNDFFQLVFQDNIFEFEIVILNRWGNVVFEDNNPDFQWNGQVNNTGANCVSGVYFYKAHFTDLHGEEKQEHGYIHLQRE